ncbi:MAG: Lhr family helicase, partial [Planctomycetota bacterium]
WSATERLIPPAEPPDEPVILRRWAGHLLRRWGIVTRDMLKAEVAAPSWGRLAREFKRLELLGEVSRGYFIEGHHGAQYGLPEAIELLRDCRARRADGKELGYLPDEPPIHITSRDPANLYAYCLGVVQEDGQHLQRKMRRGNLIHRLVVQAGQVLIYEDTQLATLDRRQLANCLRTLQHDASGREVALRLRAWNGHPIDLSPVANVLWELGFRFDGRGEMVWPAPRRPARTKPEGPTRETFLPHYAEPAPVTYGPEWTLQRASDRIRPTAAALLELLSAETAGDGWEVQWHPQGAVWRYRGLGDVRLRVNVQAAWVNMHARAFREGPKRFRFWWWSSVKAPEDLNEKFLGIFRDRLARVVKLTDHYLSLKAKR